MPLQWRHNGHDGVWNHRRLDCLLNRLFKRRSKNTSKLRVTGLCEGNPPVNGGFPSQRASNAENASIWWRHHAFTACVTYDFCAKMTDHRAKNCTLDWTETWTPFDHLLIKSFEHISKPFGRVQMCQIVQNMLGKMCLRLSFVFGVHGISFASHLPETDSTSSLLNCGWIDFSNYFDLWKMQIIGTL